MDSNKQSVPQMDFDAYAAHYSELLRDPIRDCFIQNSSHFHERKLAVLLRLLARAHVDPATQSWLDVGCGQGQFLDLAGPHFKEAVGCDPSREMLQSEAQHYRVHQATPTALPFADASFDLVTVVCVLHHVITDAQTPLAREIKRVLKPRGLCCVIEHNPRNPATRVIVKRCPVDAKAQLLNSFAVKQLFAQIGFLVLDTEYFLYLPQFLLRPIGAIERALRCVPYGGQYAVLMQADYAR